MSPTGNCRRVEEENQVLEPIIPAKEDDVARSSEFYLNMIQAELDQAKDALADGYGGRAMNLIEVVIVDCRARREERVYMTNQNAEHYTVVSKYDRQIPRLLSDPQCQPRCYAR
jgi:hypothetical protein